MQNVARIMSPHSPALAQQIARFHADVARAYLGWEVREKQMPTNRGVISAFDRIDPTVPEGLERNETSGAVRNPRWKVVPYFLSSITHATLLLRRAERTDDPLDVALYYNPASARWTCRIGTCEAQAPAEREAAAITIAAARCAGLKVPADILDAFDAR